MSAQLKDDNLWWVDFHCRKWARFVNTDTLPILGYPRETSEGATQYEHGESNPDRWGSNPKTNRAAKIKLPDWHDELIMDRIIHAINPEYRRVVYCQHQVNLKHDEMIECRIPVRRNSVNMTLLGRDGRWSWPRYRGQRLELINIPGRTYDRTLQAARYAIFGHREYHKVGR